MWKLKYKLFDLHFQHLAEASIQSNVQLWLYMILQPFYIIIIPVS